MYWRLRLQNSYISCLIGRIDSGYRCDIYRLDLRKPASSQRISALTRQNSFHPIYKSNNCLATFCYGLCRSEKLTGRCSVISGSLSRRYTLVVPYKLPILVPTAKITLDNRARIFICPSTITSNRSL